MLRTEELPPAIPLRAGMRRLLLVAAVLVFLAGVQLFVFTERTERYFAWTIEPPMTAAFLGAAYWASVAFELSAARQRWWHRARIAVPTVFVFTSLTLVVTLLHLDRFHFGPDHAVATQSVTWAWLAVYAVVPVVLAVVWWRQAGDPAPRTVEASVRGSGPELARTAPLAPALRRLVAVQAFVALAVGLALLVAPTWAAPAWPWAITALTGRAIGAWLTSLGVAAVHALVADDLDRVQPAARAWVVFALLQAWAVARYPDVPDWSSPSGIVYAAFLASALVGGLAAWRRPGAAR